MIVFESKPITTTFNSIPLENISAFNKNSAYIAGQLVIYQENIYKAITDITTTVQFVWNSTDVNNKFGYDLYNDIKMPNPTHTYCTTSTIVWSVRNKKYYQAKANGYIDFTIQNPTAPQDFNDLGATPTPLYRIELNYPDGKKNTLFWEYVSGTNRNIMFDNVVNKRSINNRNTIISTGMTFSNTGTIALNSVLASNIYEEDKIKIVGTSLNDGYYKILDISLSRLVITLDRLTTSEVVSNTVTFYTQTYIKWTDFGIDKVAIFNTECEKIELIVNAGGYSNTYEINTKTDTEWINTFQLFCFNEPTAKLSNVVTIPANFNQEFELTFFGLTQEIGEVINGPSIYLGKIEDTVTIDGKNYNPLVEADNGDIYLTDETSPITVLDGKRLSLVYPSEQTSYYKDLLKTLMSKRLVIAGDSGDKEDLPFILSWCFIRTYNFNPVVNDELNKYNLEIRELL